MNSLMRLFLPTTIPFADARKLERRIRVSDNPEGLEELDSFSDRDAPLHNGTPPLHHAVLNGRERIAAALFQRGHNPWVRNADGLSAIDLAVLARKPRTVSVLLPGSHYNPEHVTTTGATFRDVAAMTSYKTQLLADAEERELEYPLVQAILGGNRVRLEELLDRGHRPDQICLPHKHSLLHLAAVTSHPNTSEMIDLLMDPMNPNRARIDALDEYGLSPLHYAYELNSDKRVFSALARGASSRFFSSFLNEMAERRDPLKLSRADTLALLSTLTVAAAPHLEIPAAAIAIAGALQKALRLPSLLAMAQGQPKLVGVGLSVLSETPAGPVLYAAYQASEVAKCIRYIPGRSVKASLLALAHAVLGCGSISHLFATTPTENGNMLPAATKPIERTLDSLAEVRARRMLGISLGERLPDDRMKRDLFLDELLDQRLDAVVKMEENHNLSNEQRKYLLDAYYKAVETLTQVNRPLIPKGAADPSHDPRTLAGARAVLGHPIFLELTRCGTNPEASDPLSEALELQFHLMRIARSTPPEDPETRLQILAAAVRVSVATDTLYSDWPV